MHIGNFCDSVTLVIQHTVLLMAISALLLAMFTFACLSVIVRVLPVFIALL